MATTNKIFVNGLPPKLSDTDVNGLNNEINNAILTSLALDYGDKSQLAKTLSSVFSDGDYYTATDAGAATALLTPLDITGTPRFDLNVLRHGARVRFMMPFDTSGIIDTKLSIAGVTSPLRRTALVSMGDGEISTGSYVEAVFDLPNNYWQVQNYTNRCGMKLGLIMPSMHPNISHVPDGFLHPDGSAVSRTTYSGLFGTMGILYGDGDGANTFNLPDYRGRFTRYQNDGSGRDPDVNVRNPAPFGSGGDGVGSAQGYKIQSHRHGTGQSGKLGGSNNIMKVAGVNQYTSYTGGIETRPINIYVKPLLSAY